MSTDAAALENVARFSYAAAEKEGHFIYHPRARHDAAGLLLLGYPEAYTEP